MEHNNYYESPYFVCECLDWYCSDSVQTCQLEKRGHFSVQPLPMFELQQVLGEGLEAKFAAQQSSDHCSIAVKNTSGTSDKETPLNKGHSPGSQMLIVLN